MPIMGQISCTMEAKSLNGLSLRVSHSECINVKEHATLSHLITESLSHSDDDVYVCCHRRAHL